MVEYYIRNVAYSTPVAKCDWSDLIYFLIRTGVCVLPTPGPYPTVTTQYTVHA